MKELTMISLTPVNNLRGGNGTIRVSKDMKVKNLILSFLLLPPGTSVGMHEHPLKDGIQETYEVIQGPAPLINGIRTEKATCKPGEWHDLVNDTDEEILVFSRKE